MATPNKHGSCIKRDTRWPHTKLHFVINVIINHSGNDTLRIRRNDSCGRQWRIFNRFTIHWHLLPPIGWHVLSSTTAIWHFLNMVYHQKILICWWRLQITTQPCVDYVYATITISLSLQRAQKIREHTLLALLTISNLIRHQKLVERRRLSHSFRLFS